MKNTKIFVLTLVAFTLVSCKKEEKKEEGKLSQIINATKNYKEVTNSIDGITKTTNDLKNLSPLSNEELKSIFPETLLGLKRTEISITDQAMMKISQANATYQQDGKSIKINILDGAGETGSAMAAIAMMGLSATTEKTTDTGYEKTTEVNGKRMNVKEYKRNEKLDSELSFVEKNRYIINMDGNGISLEDLQKALTELNRSSMK